ncbi:chemotaxis protein CheB [Rhodanobacter sp. L36]|uniref:chemotaxis protein CheB n=1 Tax=Rhodanobacter sp. L36 TaxID=1747221 RepID=UPI00131DCD6A|nr:chemotaxis protein CheB [Rhodanobacter sp. L36]
MTHAAPAVALLFDDTELAGQLREALLERGARIVHEGGVSSLSRELLQQCGADVLVVNLDDAADDALDQLYDVIDGDRPRVVFNDAQASRKLIGWDHARWARHLAVKVLEAGDVDPPRPENAPMLDVSEPTEKVVDAAYPADVTVVHVNPESVPPAFEADLSPHPTDELHEQQAAAESENLAAELEALLASGDLADADEETTGSGLRFSEDEAPPPLHDGNFGAPATALDALPLDASDDFSHSTTIEPTAVQASVTPPVFELDHLHLAPIDEGQATQPTTVAAPLVADAAAAAPVKAPDSWALFDDAAQPAATTENSNAATFGIEKVSAADFLAPESEPMAKGFEPLMSFELVSMEEAIAPKAYEHVSEMHLDDSGSSALTRIVVLGATVDGIDSVCEFLAAVPNNSRLTFLHTQRLSTEPLFEQMAKLSARSALPVRVAEHAGRARAGEVLLAPDSGQVLLRRDGSIEVQAGDAGPSIDASFSMAANAFGRDALAIVFAGRANDAVAGSQAIHDRGGQVWVESSSGEHFADMVSGIFAERLVSYSGTPRELAAHLLEVFP